MWATRVLVFGSQGLAVTEIAVAIISKAAGGGEEGGCMARRMFGTTFTLLALLSVVALPAAAQSFRVQCPTTTITHPGASNDAEPPYTGATVLSASSNTT